MIRGLKLFYTKVSPKFNRKLKAYVLFFIEWNRHYLHSFYYKGSRFPEYISDERAQPSPSWGTAWLHHIECLATTHGGSYDHGYQFFHINLDRKIG
jgi:hypothetical protein